MSERDDSMNGEEKLELPDFLRYSLNMFQCKLENRDNLPRHGFHRTRLQYIYIVEYLQSCHYNIDEDFTALYTRMRSIGHDA